MTDRGATIFVVDDDASVRRGLERLLRSAEWNVESRSVSRDCPPASLKS